jgi:hypothetical protein
MFNWFNWLAWFYLFELILKPEKMIVFKPCA